MFCARSRPTNKEKREQKPITKKLAEFLNQFALLYTDKLAGDERVNLYKKNFLIDPQFLTSSPASLALSSSFVAVSSAAGFSSSFFSSSLSKQTVN